MENKQVLVDFSHESVLTSGKMIFLNDCFFLHPVLEEIWRSRDPWIYPPTLQSHDDWQCPKEHQSCFPSHGHIGITQPVAQKSWVTWSPGHPVTRSPGRWAPGGSLPSRSTRILQPWHGVLPASTVEQVAFLESSPRQQGLGIAMGQA